jgi:hypothetical protein
VPSVVAVIQYVGTKGWDQNNVRNINTLPLSDLTDRQGVANGSLNSNIYRMYPGFSAIAQAENETNSNYNSLQVGIRFEHKHGLTTQLAYTWSHEIDDVSSDLGVLSNPFDTRYDRGSGAMDRRHIFNASYVYSLPFFTRSSNLVAREVLGGWEVSGITVAESGLPQSITYTGLDTLGLGGGTTNRPDQVSKVSYTKKVGAWFDTKAFQDPAAPWNGGTNQGFGNARKDAVVGPGLFNWNLSLFKSIPLTAHEGPTIELRFESFNTFNHTQFQSIDANTGDGNFGAATGDYGPRTLELGGKFRF